MHELHICPQDVERCGIFQRFLERKGLSPTDSPFVLGDDVVPFAEALQRIWEKANPERKIRSFLNSM